MGEERVMVGITKLSERGQVVIPKEIREALGLRVGSKLFVMAIGDAIVLQQLGGLPERKGWDVLAKAKTLMEKLTTRL